MNILSFISPSCFLYNKNGSSAKDSICSNINSEKFKYVNIWKNNWIFLIHETTIPANWKPIFRISETDLILLRWYKLVLASFVKPLPHKRCEAGFTYEDNTSRIPGAKLCRANCGFLWPDSRWNTSRNIQQFS